VQRTIWLAATVLVCGTGTAHARITRVGSQPALRLGMAFGAISTLSATPSNISFRAASPEMGLVMGSSQATIFWQVLAGSHLQNWTLSLQSGSSVFAGCPWIPVSAVQVSCSVASVSSGGTGQCGGSFALSTASQQIAGGTEADAVSSYSVALTFTLAESWRYVAGSSCSLNLTYAVNAQ
jgi:hypothetical protein